MIDTDDKINGVNESGDQRRDSHADVVPPKSVSAENNKKADGEKNSDAKKSFASEVAVFSVKAIAVALSLVVLIISIITVAAPLSAMRVFNKLGMYERALNSGDRYIRTRLESEDADGVNAHGEYRSLTGSKNLTDDDMVEALDVCIGLSDKLMREYADGDKKSAAYFADGLDKYIRMYLSLNGEIEVSSQKNKDMRQTLAPLYHPFAYDYKHTLMTLDYAARVYSGDPKKLEMMAYDSNGSVPNNYDDAMFMMSASDQSHNLYSVVLDQTTAENLQITYLDWFVDYADQLSTYLAIQEERLGLTKTITETEAQEKYTNVLGGDEFSLFVTPQGGFTKLYNELMGASGVSYEGNTSVRRAGLVFKYSQLAYDFNTKGSVELELHRLYWLRILTSLSDRLWNMQMLLFRSRSAYGQNASAVSDEYGSDAFKYARYVIVGYDDGKPQYRDLSALYNADMADWLRNFV